MPNENTIQDGFDLLSSALYYGPAFRDMLRNDPDAFRALYDLIRRIEKNDRLMELLARQK